MGAIASVAPFFPGVNNWLGDKLHEWSGGENGFMGHFYRATGRAVAPWQGDASVGENIFSNLSGAGLTDYLQENENRRKTESQKFDTEQQRMKDEAAAAQAAYDAEVKAAKDAAAKKKAEEEAAALEAATLLATRRRASSVFATSERGILGNAPTTRKTLLGQ